MKEWLYHYTNNKIHILDCSLHVLIKQCEVADVPQNVKTFYISFTDKQDNDHLKTVKNKKFIHQTLTDFKFNNQGSSRCSQSFRLIDS